MGLPAVRDHRIKSRARVLLAVVPNLGVVAEANVVPLPQCIELHNLRSHLTVGLKSAKVALERHLQRPLPLLNRSMVVISNRIDWLELLRFRMSPLSEFLLNTSPRESRMVERQVDSLRLD